MSTLLSGTVGSETMLCKGSFMHMIVIPDYDTSNHRFSEEYILHVSYLA